MVSANIYSSSSPSSYRLLFRCVQCLAVLQSLVVLAAEAKDCGDFNVTTNALTGIILSVLGIVFFLLFVWFYCYCCPRLTRRPCVPPRRSAEKDEVLTMVVTRIYADNVLWEAVPGEAMKQAISDYIHLVREIIHKHQAYEVSYADGRFIIACNEPRVALLLVADITIEMVRMPCRAAAIDDQYRRIARGGGQEQSGSPEEVSAHNKKSTRLGVYNVMWNGLRICAGISSGRVVVRKSWGGMYVFLGSPTCMAETLCAVAVNGQILMCGQTYNTLVNYASPSAPAEPEDPSPADMVARITATILYNCEGRQVTVYQVNAIPGRTHDGIYNLPGVLELGKKKRALARAIDEDGEFEGEAASPRRSIWDDGEDNDGELEDVKRPVKGLNAHPEVDEFNVDENVAIGSVRLDIPARPVSRLKDGRRRRFSTAGMDEEDEEDGETASRSESASPSSPSRSKRRMSTSSTTPRSRRKSTSAAAKQERRFQFPEDELFELSPQRPPDFYGADYERTRKMAMMLAATKHGRMRE